METGLTCEKALLWWNPDRTQSSPFSHQMLSSFYSITYVAVSVSLEPLISGY